MKVLFIGNSYTYFNELWTLFKETAKCGGYQVETDQVTPGGWFLEWHADSKSEYGKIVDELLKNNRYDVVFLQEQSVRPAKEPALFYQAVKVLYQKIKNSNPDARIILYQTWGRRKDEDCVLKENSWTNEEMTVLLKNAYLTVANELGIEVSPVGSAFFALHNGEEYPQIELYDLDKTHPSLMGSYLAALCHYAVVFKKSPVGLSYDGGISDKEIVRILQETAEQAVKENK